MRTRSGHPVVRYAFGVAAVVVAFALRTLLRVLGMGTITRDISEARRVVREHEELLARERAARQLAEEANRHLRESEERFRLTIDEAPIGMALVALDGRFVRVNAALCQIVGYDAEELRRLTFQDITHPDDLAWDMAIARRLESGEIPRYQFEKRYIRKDGAIVPVMLSVSVLRGGDGSPLYYITQIEDITERKRMDDALRLSEARFSGIVSISADAIVCTDEAQRITLFNDGAERIFGYPRVEVLGAPLNLLIPERSRAAHREHVARFAAGPVAARRVGERGATIVGRRKSGAEFPAEAAISKLKVDGEIVLTVALRDVTAERRVEAEQRLLADAGAVLASSLDYEQAFASLAQRLARDFADACILVLIEDRERTLRLIVASADPSKATLAAEADCMRIDRNRPHLARQVLETGQPFITERLTPQEAEALGQSAEHQRLLRALVAHSVMALPLQIRGRLLGALVFVSSAPSRVFDDGHLRLAGAIADRAALAVENGRLYRAALEATQLRDQVLGVAAHDLRNPLSVIRMQAAALGRKGPEPERRAQDPQDRILRAADRMDHLIQDLLDITVIEARELGLERERLSPRRLLRDTIEAQRSLASAASLDIRLEAGPDLPDVWGDPQRLSQVLENLIGNAIKFTPSGGRIAVGAAPSQRDVVFSVADTGCGIAQEGLSHVFDRFWQMRKVAGSGAGLGLPITRGIVEAHGGRIWVESTVGRGTTFFFAIPQAPLAQLEAARAGSPSE